MLFALPFSTLAPAYAQDAMTGIESGIETETRDKFQACAHPQSQEIPQSIPLGESLGAGITEEMTPELQQILSTNGRIVPEGTIAVRHLEDGRSVFLNSEGEALGELTGKNSTRTKRGVIPEKAKELLGACLGFSWESGPLAEAIFRQVTSVKTAIKFIIRRIGLGAAIGCVGGIIWHYI